jgi:hypothetical protein
VGRRFCRETWCAARRERVAKRTGDYRVFFTLSNFCSADRPDSPNRGEIRQPRALSPGIATVDERKPHRGEIPVHITAGRALSGLRPIWCNQTQG